MGDTQAGTVLRRDSGGLAGEVGEFNPALKGFNKGSKTLSGEAVSPVTLEASRDGGGEVLLQCHPLLTLPILILGLPDQAPPPTQGSKQALTPGRP